MNVNFAKPRYIVLASRPDVGRRSFYYYLALKALESKQCVAIYSLERCKESVVKDIEIVQSFLPIKKPINIEKLFINSEIFTIEKLEVDLINLKAKQPELTLCIIDYLGLFSTETKSDLTTGLIYISKKIKVLSQKLGMTIILTGMLDRDLGFRYRVVEDIADVVLYLKLTTNEPLLDIKKETLKEKSLNDLFQEAFVANFQGKYSKRTLYLSSLLLKWHEKLYSNLSTTLKRHNYSVETLKDTKDIWLRDFMPLNHNGKFYSYNYNPDYLQSSKDKPYITDPMPIFKNLGIKTKHIDLVLDGGNLLFYKDTIIMTDKFYSENPKLKNDKERLKPYFWMFKKIVVIPRDPHSDEIYGHADGMVRFIDDEYLLVNSYSSLFRSKLLKSLKEQGIRYTELKLKEDTKHSWGYINFLQLDDLIIQPSIDNVNDLYITDQLQKLYPYHNIELVDAKPLTKKGGVFNCISWEW
jgi:agmatine/peptidylarginine deiminase